MNTPRTLMLAGAFLAASFAASTQALAAPGRGGNRGGQAVGVPTRRGPIVAPQPQRKPQRQHADRGHQAPVQRGHYEIRTEQVLVERGHFERIHIPSVERVVRGRFGRFDRIVVQPARTERVWVPDRYETRRTRVWVPDRYEIQHRGQDRGSVIGGVLHQAGIILGGSIRF